MSFQKKKFNFTADEPTYLLLRMLIGKSYITNQDFQKTITSLIYNATKEKRK